MPLSFCQQIMENAEINNIIKIVGLQYKKSYDDPESMRSLRYGKIMIMTDQVSCLLDATTALSARIQFSQQFNVLLLFQDQDGSHIKGLLINFFHHNWPSLLKHTFLEEFITPIVKVRDALVHLMYEIWKYSAEFGTNERIFMGPCSTNGTWCHWSRPLSV